MNCVQQRSRRDLSRLLSCRIDVTCPSQCGRGCREHRQTIVVRHSEAQTSSPEERLTARYRVLTKLASGRAFMKGRQDHVLAKSKVTSRHVKKMGDCWRIGSWVAGQRVLIVGGDNE